ncbi:hypothetical protein BDN72DRAFT_840804 [Pluteus cervinus]|uniref:Uncharacterized protein n=1 Tax=Pluteus cervinus TaxID=181527 RepID=A0ACD3AUE5_9AGAR|nr:hypothetical protein BDN72DRAFT_840804 [Pluteus cervinus]
MSLDKVRVYPPNRNDFNNIQEALLPWNTPCGVLFETFQPLRSVPPPATRYYKIQNRVYCPPTLVQGYEVKSTEFGDSEALGPAAQICFVYGVKSQCILVVDQVSGTDFSVDQETKERIIKWGEGKELLWYLPQVRPGWRKTTYTPERASDASQAVPSNSSNKGQA